MKFKVPIGYKFIAGFIVVVASAAFVPKVIAGLDLPEWLREPVSFLTAIVVGLTIGSLFTRGFTRRFNHLAYMAQKISQGDLTNSLRLKTNSEVIADETTDLAEALNLMLDNLKELVGRIIGTVDRLAEFEAAFKNIADKGDETSRAVISKAGRIYSGTVEQASRMEEATGTIKKMYELADSVAVKVQETASASQRVNTMVQRGVNTAGYAIEKIENIFRGIEKTEAATTHLKERLNDIGKVLDVIIHVSRQTDLLALNATIEASKAGEYAKGFALVAEEIRRLSDNTNKSVEDVGLIVRDLRAEIERVVSASAEGTFFVKDGRDDIRKIRDILGDISEYTSRVAEEAAMVIGLTEKQKDKARSTVSSIEGVSAIGRENLSAAGDASATAETHRTAVEETLSAARRLSELSSDLKAVVSGFKID
ncbi:MAG: methyl-accepting chemotaxis protein [Deltaproteobacteria bacterium]|nr:methyl-accepting chemotaxis protein [Deltaproteobacteria bacterium]